MTLPLRARELPVPAGAHSTILGPLGQACRYRSRLGPRSQQFRSPRRHRYRGRRHGRINKGWFARPAIPAGPAHRDPAIQPRLTTGVKDEQRAACCRLRDVRRPGRSMDERASGIIPEPVVEDTRDNKDLLRSRLMHINTVPAGPRVHLQYQRAPAVITTPQGTDPNAREQFLHGGVLDSGPLITAQAFASQPWPHRAGMPCTTRRHQPAAPDPAPAAATLRCKDTSLTRHWEQPHRTPSSWGGERRGITWPVPA